MGVINNKRLEFSRYFWDLFSVIVCLVQVASSCTARSCCSSRSSFTSSRSLSRRSSWRSCWWSDSQCAPGTSSWSSPRYSVYSSTWHQYSSSGIYSVSQSTHLHPIPPPPIILTKPTSTTQWSIFRPCTSFVCHEARVSIRTVPSRPCFMTLANKAAAMYILPQGKIHFISFVTLKQATHEQFHLVLSNYFRSTGNERVVMKVK